MFVAIVKVTHDRTVRFMGEVRVRQLISRGQLRIFWQLPACYNVLRYFVISVESPPFNLIHWFVKTPKLYIRKSVIYGWYAARALHCRQIGSERVNDHLNEGKRRKAHYRTSSDFYKILLLDFIRTPLMSSWVIDAITKAMHLTPRQDDQICT